MSLFKINATKEYGISTRVRNVYGGEKKPRKPKRKKQSEDRIISDIKKFFEQEQDDYYRPLRGGIFCCNNYTEYKSYCDRNKILSFIEYLNETKPYLEDIMNNLKKYGTWKTQ